MEKELWSDCKRVVFFGLPLSFTKYRLTTNRLFVNTGFLTQREDEVRLYRITDVSLSRTLMQRVFGLSTIHCNSSDKTLGNFDIINIKDGEAVKEILSQSVERERIARRVSTRENMIDVSDDDDWN
ncbi:PH domain-containing protein [Intestinibacter bartlettii]|uniref:PH domain-containing protein n=1 Tax=Intestinibacter bartlettii TaxID=261299 RepID=UPI0008218CD6|nr:PH domain-containing protein [Intestinibacter bartlettii]SCJ12764.1 Bacterial membrane flanked domain [uncultured Clostridium sp.]